MHEKLSLTVSNDGWCERLGEREWWDFTGESRLLAWALAHSGLLEGSGRILREPLMPSALTEGIPLESETAALQPGYVFELPSSLDTVRVVIRANGTRVGHGELVAVGDVLGVQLLALETDGLR